MGASYPAAIAVFNDQEPLLQRASRDGPVPNCWRRRGRDSKPDDASPPGLAVTIDHLARAPHEAADDIGQQHNHSD
jgi:hypothetical protein